jgi:type II secretory pathway component PulF
VDPAHLEERAVNPVMLALGVAWGVVMALPVARRAHDVAPRARSSALVTSRHSRRETSATARSQMRRVLSLRPVHALATRRRARARRRAAERTVPLVLDVLTVAARAGCTPRVALAATATWTPPATRGLLVDVEHRCRLGVSLADSLDTLAAEEPALASIAEVLALSERSGAPTAELLERLADEARADLRRRAEAHARRVPVRLLFPLVFLVLPAFGLLTVVPALLTGLRQT